MTCWPRIIFVWAIMTALPRSGIWNAQAVEPLSLTDIRMENHTYSMALLDIEYAEVIDGKTVGGTASRGRFHHTFETIYQHGTQDDFIVLTTYSNRVARAMGLLSLRYCNKPRAKEIFLRDLCGDTNQVQVLTGGCCGRMRPFNEVALDILTDDDFLETSEIVARIPLSPGPAWPKPPAPSTPIMKQENNNDTNPVQQP
jgi:hypothetical protein